jgi:hypothetical protein
VLILKKFKGKKWKNVKDDCFRKEEGRVIQNKRLERDNMLGLIDF